MRFLDSFPPDAAAELHMSDEVMMLQSDQLSTFGVGLPPYNAVGLSGITLTWQ